MDFSYLKMLLDCFRDSQGSGRHMDAAIRWAPAGRDASHVTARDRSGRVGSHVLASSPCRPPPIFDALHRRIGHKQGGVLREQCMPWRPKCCWPWVRPRVRVCGPCPGFSWHSSPLFRPSSLVQGICVDEGAAEARARCASLARQGHGPRRRQVYDRDEAAGGAAGKGRCSPARCSYTSGG